MSFAVSLLHWHHHENKRQMPWKHEKDPYKIWLSEIILQQTRVAQGTDYYLKFIKKYPTIYDLSAASLDEVLKDWEGLGYYSRARNLHFTAQDIVKNYNGIFPTNYTGLLKLKGVGSYTAAAIASFAYEEEVYVLDGNALRVVARYCGINDPINTSHGKKKVGHFLEKQIKSSKPSAFNQAIMDFGALICKPQSPLCQSCPLKWNCVSFQKDEVALYPKKRKKNIRRNRFFHFLVIQEKSRLLIQQRQEKDIWHSLYQFPMWETHKNKRMTVADWENIPWIKKVNSYAVSKGYKQTLSHQNIRAYFYEIKLNLNHLPVDIDWVEEESLYKYAFPGIIRCFLEDKKVILNEKRVR